MITCDRYYQVTEFEEKCLLIDLSDVWKDDLFVKLGN